MLTNFSTDPFVVDTSAFTNSFTGTFGVARGDSVAGGTDSQVYVTYTAVVPEPSALALAGLDLAGIAYAALRIRRAA